MTALTAGNIGAVTVTPDDYVFADDDGVVVVAGRISTGLSRLPATLRRARARRRCGCSRASCCERSSIWRNTWQNGNPIPLHVPGPSQDFGGAIEI